MKYLFFWLIGCFGLFGTFLMPDISGEGLSVVQTDLFNFLLRIACFNFSVLLLIVPNFMKNGWVHSDYYNATRYEKAKTEFYIISFALPGILAISYLAFTIPNVKKGLVLSVAAVAAFRYLECIYIFLMKKG